MDTKGSDLFSIIVPVYKVENYLDKCVLSIINQKYKNFEIILVDDGSPDLCPQICDKYAKLDKRVKVIHKTNRGLSSARNTGVRIAHADYIIFVDSDDYWNDDNALSLLANKINLLGEVDVLIYNNIDYSCVSGKSAKCNRNYDIHLLETMNKESIIKYLFNNSLFPGAAWVTVTRRQFLLDNSIEFIEGIKAEDIDWLLNVFLNAEKYSAVNAAFYVYQKYRNDSITSTADEKTIDDILYTIKIWFEKLKETKYNYIRETVYNYLYNHYLCAVLIYANLEALEKISCKKKLEEYQFLSFYSRIPLLKICGKLPISSLSKLLNIYRRIRQF